MSYSSRSSLFLKVKAVSQHKSTFVIRKISGVALVILAIAIFISPPLTKIMSSFDFWVDSRSSNFYLAAEKFNKKIAHFKQNIAFIFQSPEIIDNLKKENQKLQLQLANFLTLQAENDQLKNMVKFIPQSAKHVATAQLIIHSNNQIGMGKILAGKVHGLHKGQFVTNAAGCLLGKIISTGNASSKILLVTEPTSRIGVYFPRTNAKAIVGGNYSGKLEIIFAENELINSVEDGDIVVTSGGDGIVSGLIVGKVEKSDSNLHISLAQMPESANVVSVFEVAS